MRVIDRTATRRAGRALLGGTASIFVAEALLIPTGIATAAFLSRRFGPEGYGLLTLASVVVVWLESNVATALSRPAIKVVGDAAGEWRPVGTAVFRLYTLVGCALGFVVWALSSTLAALLDEPLLGNYLRLLALDVPLFCMAQAHRNIIVGMGRFRARAVVSGARWCARLVLVVIFVSLSGSLVGAIWASICASLVELIVCRLYVRPRLSQSDAYPVRRLCGYALPLVASALCMSLYSRLDLLMLKALGGTTAETGIYGVAQNLSLLPTLFSYSFAPVLLSTLGRTLREGEETAAREMGRQAMRAVLLLLPVAAITAGVAPDVVALIFGREFLPAAPLLSLLILSSLALTMIAVTTSIMTVAGKPKWTFQLAWPLLLGAAAGHYLLIPRAGALGAALVTTILASLSGLLTIGLVYRLWRIAPPTRTLLVSVAVSLCAYALTSLIPASGFLLLLKLAVAVVFVVFAFLLCGELSAQRMGATRVVSGRGSASGLKAPGELL